MQSHKTGAQFTLLVRCYRVANEIEMLQQFVLTFNEIDVLFRLFLVPSRLHYRIKWIQIHNENSHLTTCLRHFLD